MRECVAAFIVRDQKILLGKRSPDRAFYPNIWDVFGGHLKVGETPEIALQRELFEELGIIPLDFEFLHKCDEPFPDKNGAGWYYVYVVKRFDGEPYNLEPTEHVLIDWFNYTEALRLPLVHPLYTRLIEQMLSPTAKA